MCQRSKGQAVEPDPAIRAKTFQKSLGKSLLKAFATPAPLTDRIGKIRTVGGPPKYRRDTDVPISGNPAALTIFPNRVSHCIPPIQRPDSRP
ncbi:hypothetical protein [Roseovarius sp. THAF9]|uniref:hypothetical protein n=1 Tax=Roseovarius sp. THAF9 TaxID=2587847 RepID=UPI001268B3B2|nr:hypothetical protein [Roseovarius sp. THAF9]